MNEPPEEKAPRQGGSFSLPIPPGWAEDPLSEYLDMARQNDLVTFVRLPRFYTHLKEVDQLFNRFIDGLHYPDEDLTPLFVVRSHSVYRAAVRVAMSGAAYETQPLARSCLELAVYAHHIARDFQLREAAREDESVQPPAWERWLRRDESPDARRAARQEFTWAKVSQSLIDADAQVGDRVKKAYEDAIDMGAHPNPLGLLVYTSIVEGERGREHVTDYLVEDSLQLRAALHLVARAGLCALDVIRVTYPARFALLVLNEELDRLKRVNTELVAEVQRAPERNRGVDLRSDNQSGTQ